MIGASKTQEQSETGIWHEVVRHLKQFWYLPWTDIWAALKEAFTEWIDDNVPRLGASLAFYTLLSLAPLLVVVLAVAAVAYGRQAAQGQLFWQIRGLVGPEGASAIQGLIAGANKPGAGALATVLGLVTLAIGASSVVVELRSALNTIWHVPPKPDSSGLSSIISVLSQISIYIY